jgi:hypothetical protein
VDFNQVMEMALKAGPFAILILGYLYWTKSAELKDSRTDCKDLQKQIDNLRDTRLADAMKLLPVIESNNSVGLAVAAAMENRNRAQDGSTQVLSGLTIEVEHQKEILGQIWGSVNQLMQRGR